MRGTRLMVATFLVAAGIGGAWIMTSRGDPANTVSVEGPAAQPTTPATATMEEVIRQALDNVANQRFCEAPPVELTEEQKQMIERVTATLPPPPTVPGSTSDEVVNIHRRVVPC